MNKLVAVDINCVISIGITFVEIAFETITGWRGGEGEEKIEEDISSDSLVTIPWNTGTPVATSDRILPQRGFAKTIPAVCDGLPPVASS